jgi:hypothetical protein
MLEIGIFIYYLPVNKPSCRPWQNGVVQEIASTLLTGLFLEQPLQFHVVSLKRHEIAAFITASEKFETDHRSAFSDTLTSKPPVWGKD